MQLEKSPTIGLEASVELDKQIERALQVFYLDLGDLPDRLSRLAQHGYLDERDLLDPWGRPYLYLSPGENSEIDLYSLGADGLSGGDGQNADIGNWKEQE